MRSRPNAVASAPAGTRRTGRRGSARIAGRLPRRARVAGPGQVEWAEAGLQAKLDGGRLPNVRAWLSGALRLGPGLQPALPGVTAAAPRLPRAAPAASRSGSRQREARRPAPPAPAPPTGTHATGRALTPIEALRAAAGALAWWRRYGSCALDHYRSAGIIHSGHARTRTQRHPRGYRDTQGKGARDFPHALKSPPAAPQPGPPSARCKQHRNGATGLQPLL